MIKKFQFGGTTFQRKNDCWGAMNEHGRYRTVMNHEVQRILKAYQNDIKILEES